MRNSDPIFWPPSDVNASYQRNRDQNYSDSINILQTQWSQADIDQRYSMGEQDVWGSLYPGLVNYRRKFFNFNLINSHVQMISGYQRRNRKSSICIPVLSPSQKTADQMTKCLYYVHNKSGAYQIYSDAFEQGALIQGIGFISIFNDYSSDPISGDIKLRYIDFKSVLIDPYFRRHDLSDCRFFWTRQFFDREEAANLYPQFRDEIMGLPGGTYRDDKFYYMPEVYQIQFPNVIAFDEYWYLATRQCLYLVDTHTNETQEFTGDEEDLRVIVNQMKGRLKVIEKTKPTVRRQIILNDRTLVDEANPYGIDRYPFVPVLGYFSPDTPYYAYKFRGVVRDMRDAQYLFNRRKVADLDILESQQQGLKIRQGSLVTPDDAFNQGNGRALFYKKDASADDIQPMPIIPPAPTMIQMEEMLQDVMHRISGVNETMLGADIDSKAGIITMLRNSAGITTLTRLFDQFDEAQRLCGDIIIEMIQKNWTYGKVKQVIGEDPTAEFDDKAFFKYGCKVIQGALTETQQQLELAQILQLNEMYPDTVPIEEVIERMQIQNKDKVLEKIAQKQQAAAQQQQQMAELQMEQMRIDNQTKLSYAHSQEGLAMERVAKIQTDKAVAEDKLKRAHEQDTHALLNLVKTLKELQGTNLENLVKELQLLNELKAQTAPELESKQITPEVAEV